MKIYLLIQANYYFSMNVEDCINAILIASADEEKIDNYITDNKITLGEKHLYDSNYHIYKKESIELN